MRRETRIHPSIFIAVRNNRETAREQLGSELMEQLSHLCYDTYGPYSKGNVTDYEAFKEILHCT